MKRQTEHLLQFSKIVYLEILVLNYRNFGLMHISFHIYASVYYCFDKGVIINVEAIKKTISNMSIYFYCFFVNFEKQKYLF
jgi:hypothetical protein